MIKRCNRCNAFFNPDDSTSDVTCDDCLNKIERGERIEQRVKFQDLNVAKKPSKSGKYDKICPICGTIFYTNYPHKKVCGNQQCTDEYRRIRVRKNNKKYFQMRRRINNEYNRFNR